MWVEHGLQSVRVNRAIVHLTEAEIHQLIPCNVRWPMVGNTLPGLVAWHPLKSSTCSSCLAGQIPSWWGEDRDKEMRGLGTRALGGRGEGSKRVGELVEGEGMRELGNEKVGRG